MNRPALIVGSILLFGCSAPYQLLIHNGLSGDANITVRWSQAVGGKRQVQDKTVFVPQGRAEEAFVWYSPPSEEGVDFLWRDVAGPHRVHVRSEEIPAGVYHAYLDARHVRFAKSDTMDCIDQLFTWYMAPFVGFCVLTALALRTRGVRSRRVRSA